ncbi:MAG: c-type cytochrome [Desulfuromonas sp.]|nr:c-type cytochrome [Desulfuromonas sp.]
MRAVIRLVVVLSIFSAVSLWAQPHIIPFSAPDETSIPQGAAGDKIRRGRLILTHTPQQLPAYATSNLRCSNCHLKAGTVAYAAPWVGVTTRYPRYSNRSAADVSLRQRIQGCFKRSLNGVAPPVDSEPMEAIVAYMSWLSQGIDDGYLVEGWGFPRLNEVAEPDRERGRQLFVEHCAVCHGKDGQGSLSAVPQRYPYGFPPLWGGKSFNIAAGTARLHKAAAFIQRNMPFSSGGLLTIQQAYDVADFVIHQPRADYPAKVNDWPQGGKPIDARY